ncbi:OmpH family outer membrane protein [Roseivirga pacifica]|uniref:OmpH family outer membrane protein n=1 Tax=Roseivirga pacifica TaxID=1267423 RepID=UPI00227C0E0D|nr:OmpH family outer membrane protein [Roseivirga pacifica]
MKKYIIIPLLLITVSLSAQIKVGLIEPEKAMNHMPEYQELIQRFKQLSTVRMKELDSLEAMVVEKNAALQKAVNENKSQEVITSLNSELETFTEVFQIKRSNYLQELGQREAQLLQSFNLKIEGSIEQIALEEGINIVMRADHIDEGFRRHIGKENFIDITDLIIERIAEK